jgi:hypothetical protein
VWAAAPTPPSPPPSPPSPSPSPPPTPPGPPCLVSALTTNVSILNHYCQTHTQVYTGGNCQVVCPSGAIRSDFCMGGGGWNHTVTQLCSAHAAVNHTLLNRTAGGGGPGQAPCAYPGCANHANASISGMWEIYRSTVQSSATAAAVAGLNTTVTLMRSTVTTRAFNGEHYQRIQISAPSLSPPLVPPQPAAAGAGTRIETIAPAPQTRSTDPHKTSTAAHATGMVGLVNRGLYCESGMYFIAGKSYTGSVYLRSVAAAPVRVTFALMEFGEFGGNSDRLGKNNRAAGPAMNGEATSVLVPSGTNWTRFNFSLTPATNSSCPAGPRRPNDPQNLGGIITCEYAHH